MEDSNFSADLSTRVLRLPERTVTTVIRPAISANAILDEGIDRYLRPGPIGNRLNDDGVTERSVRLMPTSPRLKQTPTAASGEDAQQCLLILRWIQLSSFASCCRDAP